ncbi:MAG: PP2C family serine/threonine-protein phosphatase [Verrucomicrobiota bacterium]
MPWKCTAASVVGNSHRASGKPNQDAARVCYFDAPEGRAVVFALSDGAGSSTYSQEASARVVGTLLRLVLEWNRSLAAVDFDTARRWFEIAGTHLRSVLTAECQCDPAELYCTAILGVFWPGGGFCVQIGDGAVGVKTDAGWSLATVPSVGKYAGETYFLTSPNAVSEHFQFVRYDIPVRAVVGFTDGLQPVLLNPGFQIHPPVLEFLLQPVASASDPSGLTPQLEAFLNLPELVEKTDDDKSIVLLVSA